MSNGNHGIYAIYSKAHAPQAMRDKHPRATEYNINGHIFILFCEPLEEVTGTPATNIIDLPSMNLTNKQLDAAIDQLASEPPTGREVQINLEQSTYIYETRFYTGE